MNLQLHLKRRRQSDIIYLKYTMPKIPSATSVKIKKYVREFGEDVFSTDGKVLLCVVCGIKVSHEKKYYIQQHLCADKHKKAAKLKSATKVQHISSFLDKGEQNEFFKDLTRMMIACDIALSKANQKEFKIFFEKYAQKKLPDQSTMRKFYLKDVYENVLEEIRAHVGDSNIFVSIDETTDKAGRFVCNVIVGPLREDGRGHLLTTEVIPKVNASEIARVFEDSLKLLWPENVQRKKVLAFVTDAAPYMKKSAAGLQLLYPQMIHVTCIAHGIHRVCEQLRSQYPDVDALIANIKKIFLKSASRTSLFKEKEPNLPLPPRPVLTRWGTWLDAAIYYAKNYNAINGIVESLDDDAACIIFAKKLLAKEQIRTDLAFIHANFGFLVGEDNAFKKLQKAGEPISNMLAVLDDVEIKLKQARGPISKIILKKFEDVFKANDGLQILRVVAKIINGEHVTLPHNMDIHEVECLNWTPLVSVDVERSFSSFKTMMRDNRMRLLPENFKMHLVALCFYTKS